MPTYKSPLHQTVSTTKTDVWNDSCAIKELTYAIEHGAVGATSNPTIVYTVLKQELGLWKDRIQQLISENPNWSEVEITWKIFEEIGLKGAELLLPVFEREGGKKGRLSIQTNPANYRDAKAVADQAIYFDSLAPNIQVKAPVTQAGVKAIEEATYQGVNINATVCFTVPQSLAVAEAVERGLKRREAEGKSVENMSPVCTIMVGRTDDWIKSGGEKGRYHDHTWLYGLGRRGSDEKSLQHLPGTRLSYPSARSCLSKPSALVRVHWR